MIHFELIFGVARDKNILFFAHEYRNIPAPFVEKICLFPLNCFCIFVENLLAIYVRVSSRLSVLFNGPICLSLCQYQAALITKALYFTSTF